MREGWDGKGCDAMGEGGWDGMGEVREREKKSKK